MESPDPNNQSQSLTDVLYRRLKNRERQRRYRERKRLQLIGRKVRVTKHSSQLQLISLPINVTVEQAVTRVYCKRDWKKDARRAHAANQEAISNGFVSSGQSLAGEKQTPHFPSGTGEAEQGPKSGSPACMSSSSYAGNSEVRTKGGKRDWKAEARNKRN